MDVCSYCEHEHAYDRLLGDCVIAFSDVPCHYLETTCPNCAMTTRLYSEDWWHLMAEGYQNGLQVTLIEFAPPSVVGEWRQANSNRMLEEAVSEELEAMFRRAQPELGTGE